MEPVKIIVAGGRDFNDYDLLERTLNQILPKYDGPKEIVSGRARGADSLGEQYATKNSISIKMFSANWYRHGKSAGPIRNTEMADYADVLVAFWDGESRGTKHMIDIATKKGLSVNVVKYYK